MVVVSLSFSGSGDDIMSALEVSGFAMECQRRLNASEAVVVIWRGVGCRCLDRLGCLDIGRCYQHGPVWYTYVLDLGEKQEQ